ncbi:hypothetical protein Q8W37_15475 [Shimia thalassica]|uniref:hypothetical protein n=1 Tax=Shimia thalassica TaxID=1715693 RepID=UPI0027337309|nr:hypothetical protein [Shimia thalassica]MDP2581338.1 hypothetical protein [Shimia thalassica]
MLARYRNVYAKPQKLKEVSDFETLSNQPHLIWCRASTSWFWHAEVVEMWRGVALQVERCQITNRFSCDVHYQKRRGRSPIIPKFEQAAAQSQKPLKATDPKLAIRGMWRAEWDKSENWYAIVIKGPFAWSDPRMNSLSPQRKLAEELVRIYATDPIGRENTFPRKEIIGIVQEQTGVSRRQALNAVDKAWLYVVRGRSNGKK